MASQAWLPEPLLPLITKLAGATPLWLVGGAVRDSLLQRPTSDFDFVVDGNAPGLARLVANALRADYYTLDAERGIGRVIHSTPAGVQTLDFSRLRAPNINADLVARDFTVNAMAVALADPGSLIDPARGFGDLRDRRLRACGPHAIADDPVRAMRCVRLSIELRLQIEPSTFQQVTEAASTITSVSPERLRDELFELLGQARPAHALRLLDHVGLLEPILPETAALKAMAQPPPHAWDGWAHSLTTVKHLAELLRALRAEGEEEPSLEPALRSARVRIGRFRSQLNQHFQQVLTIGRSVGQLALFAALYHDTGKPGTASTEATGVIRFIGHEAEGARLSQERARALRLSTAEIERLRLIVLHHLRPASLDRAGEVSPRAAYRFFRDAGQAGIDVVVLSLADLLATYEPPIPTLIWESRLEIARQLLEAGLEWPSERLSPPPLLRGDRLAQAIGIMPGPEVGNLLERIREAQAAGEVRTANEALEFARRLWAQGIGDEGETP
jgi:tRNA nucleotidyltransferase/poly(A) polymerase